MVRINQDPAVMDANMHLDESQESLIIIDVKRMSVNNQDVMTSLPPWIMVVGLAFSSLCVALGLFRTYKRNEEELDACTERSSRDREKRTARNISMMLRYCKERIWLSEEHISRSCIANVLSEHIQVLEDDVSSSKLMCLDTMGRKAAALHLCTRMWKLFGDLSREEGVQYFIVSDPILMRKHFTTGFQYKTLAQMLGREEFSEKLRPKRADVEKKMNARIRELHY